MSSYREFLRQLDRRAKEKRAQKRGPDLIDTWHNCGLKVRAQSGQILYPVVVNRKDEAYGYSLLLHLPKGLSDASFRARGHLLAWALGGEVEVERARGKLRLKILTGEIGDFYPYKLPDTAGLFQPVPVGYGREGLIMLDLARAPHLLVGGGSGYGKSAWIHQAIVTLLSAGAQVSIIDLKRLEFAAYRAHCNCVFDERGALELLQGVNAEMERRMGLLESAGVVKIQDYRGALPYMVVFIDEVAELQDEKCWALINRLVRLARALGISIVAASQRTAVSVINGDTRALFTCRLAFRTADETNSRIILDGPQAAYLPAGPGRAVFKFGDRCREVQTMFIEAPGQVKKILSTMPPKPVQSTEITTKVKPY